MATLRTDETLQKYHQLIAAGGLKGHCVLCEAPALTSFTYWKIIANAYPYDRIAKMHHMIVPLRHVTEAEVTKEEWQEYNMIKNDHIQSEYEFVIEPTNKMKTIPSHLHIHVIVLKD